MGAAASSPVGRASSGMPVQAPSGGPPLGRRSSIGIVMTPASAWESDVNSPHRTVPRLTFSDLKGIVDENILYIKELFMAADPDGTLGGLDMKDFTTGFSIPPSSFSHKFYKAIRDVDTQRISLETLVRLIARIRTGQEIRFLWHMFDVDVYGLLDVPDLRKTLEDCVRHLKHLGRAHAVESEQSKTVRMNIIELTKDAIGSLKDIEEDVEAQFEYSDFVKFVGMYESVFDPSFDVWIKLQPYSTSCQRLLEVVGYHSRLVEKHPGES